MEELPDSSCSSQTSAESDPATGEYPDEEIWGESPCEVNGSGDMKKTEGLAEKPAAPTECLDDETWGEPPREVNPVQKGASGAKKQPQTGAERTRAYRKRKQEERAAHEDQKRAKNQQRTAASPLKKKQ